LFYNPNVGVYEASDKSGALRIFTARQVELLVGYQIFFVCSHPHTMQSIQAVQDILFIDKPFVEG